MYRKHSYAEKGVSMGFFRLTFYFMTETGNVYDFSLFFINIHFLHVIKQKLGPILKI